MTLRIDFQNSYAALPDRFFARQAPTPVPQPRLVALNEGLARDLDLDPDTLRTPQGVDMLAGNALPKGADPIAQTYAGHQFGGWVPQLGDGRAVLLGELTTPQGQRDIVLKGAGRTPYSRGGDGRAWLGPVLREYVVSEAMHALGIPTTRALAATATGAPVLREAELPGAVLTRVAASHIRVGTFQYFAARQDTEALQTLADHVIARHYPDAETPLDLLKAVITAQARLIARWMGVGFIHGVMNTDNMAISGETIDYGPCAFMDTYHPETLYSSIDRMGRYAYARQPEIAVWNLAQFASCLLPLMDDQDDAVAAATRAVHAFPDIYAGEWAKVFRAKIGLTTEGPDDIALIHDLLDRMTAQRADFTNTFRALGTDTARDQFLEPAAFDEWEIKWQARLTDQPDPVATMRAANPAFIPRNHRVEQMIQAAVAGDMAPLERLTATLAHPYDDQPDAQDLARPPTEAEVVTQTFCGT